MEPIIVNMLYWHQLPQPLQLSYAGQSRMGRIYALDAGGQLEFIWAEGSIYEGAAWHCSRALNPIRDSEVVSILRGGAYGKAV